MGNVFRQGGAARDYAAKMERKFDKKMVAYLCPICNKYHVGSK